MRITPCNVPHPAIGSRIPDDHLPHPDQVQLLFATPHRWTPWFRTVPDRKVVLPDASRWDYKHQVMDSAVPPWRALAWTKTIEVALQARPKALARTFLERDPHLRHAMKWYAQMGRRVWTSCPRTWSPVPDATDTARRAAGRRCP